MPAVNLFTRFVVQTMPLMPKALVWRVARRYVAGTDLSDAVETVRRLNGLGAMATVDVLGESVTERDRARAAVDEYMRVYDVIEAEGLDSNVSIKPTMLGLQIDEGFCLEGIEGIVEAAAKHGNFLRIDMEDRTATDPTLRMYRSLHERFGNVGTVLQSYMRRTLKDVEELPEEGANIRLCKGIYIEPRTAAWKGYETVRANFVAALEAMLRKGVYVGIATHDEYLVCRAVELVRRFGLSPKEYEFQMLLGVDEELRDILVAEGHRLRIYVPYGRDWHAYSLRRMRENPAIAGHVIRATLGIPG